MSVRLRRGTSGGRELHEISDQDLPSHGGTTSPQSRTDGTREHDVWYCEEGGELAGINCGRGGE